jgi:hypothetical protein
MSEDVELAKLLKDHQGQLKAIADAAGSGDRDKVIDAVASLMIALATGNPLVAALAPLGRKGVAQIFGNTVNAALTRELAVLSKNEERWTFLTQIADVVEVLLGQALIQIVKSQHAVNDEVLESLGGMRRDLEMFRREFSEQLTNASENVRVDELVEVEAGIGVRVAAATTKRVVLRHLVVRGGVGIDLT